MSRAKRGPYTGYDYPLFRGFLGLNNVAEPHNLRRDELGRVELAEAVNFEIQDDLSASTRAGRLTIRAGNTHSLWSKGRFCFMVNNGDLVRMYENETFAVVFPGIGTHRVSYDLAMGKVYAANGSVQMVITDSDVSSWDHTPIVQSVSDGRTLGFPAPFDLVLWHSSRMFVSRGNAMYESELFAPGVFDIEKYLQFTSPITDWISVRGGIYLSTAEAAIFLPGPDINSFKQEVRVREVPMLPGTLCVVEGRAIGKGMPGMCAVWSGPNGEVCIADEDGHLIEILDQQIRLEKHSRGGSAYKNGRLIFSLEE